jgi:hypothetical protein
MTHTWKIYDLKRTIADGVVTTITYGCESELENASARKIGDLTVTGSVEEENFIPYEELTQEIVLGWVTSSVDTASIETLNSSSIAQQIEAQAAITEVNGIPWEGSF